jgi:anthranilate/para-aminobenzoate synthase component I
MTGDTTHDSGSGGEPVGAGDPASSGELSLSGELVRTEAALAGAILRALAQGWLPGLAWLDGAAFGRSFVGADPDLVIEGDDIAQLDSVDARWRSDRSRVWVGWLTYELGVDHLLGRRAGRGPRPGLCLRRYPAMIERDVEGNEEAHGDPDAIKRLRSVLRRAAAAPMVDPPWPLEPLRPRLAPEEHHARLERARQHLTNGDSQQINLSQQFGARWKASAPPGTPVRVASTYANLRRVRPASMGAVLEADADTWFLSNSPELLLDLRRGQAPGGGDLAHMWPIKGTRPRDDDPAHDAAAAESLRDSEADRAQHRATLELVQADLGRIAVPGTIEASLEPRLATLPTMHHLVSQVTASLPADLPLRSVVEAVFPGASITGIPKRRTAELIDQLEEHARGVYCGAIIVLEPRGLTMSIPIRTGIVDRYGLTLCVGGGVPLIADPESERQETLARIAAFSVP